MRAAERELYRLHAKLPIHRRRIEQARALVRTAVRTYEGTWACSVSGGKDSAAMLAVCIEAGWRGPLMHFFFRETPPENTALAHALAERYALDLLTIEVPGAFDVYDAVGHFFSTPETAAERSVMNAMLRDYKRRVDAFSRRQGWRGLFIGLRAEESRERSITLKRHGPIYQSKNRATATCCPLARWSGRDVWAALGERDLPWLDRYDSAESREEERSETTFLAAEGLWRYGQGQSLRRRYPAMWSGLLKDFPGLSVWG